MSPGVSSKRTPLEKHKRLSIPLRFAYNSQTKFAVYLDLEKMK